MPNLSVKRFVLTCVLTIIFGILAFTIGIERVPRCSWGDSGCKIGSMPNDKLNPILWLPAPLTTPTNKYSLGGALVPANSQKLLITEVIAFIYWIILSYLISLIVFRPKSPNV